MTDNKKGTDRKGFEGLDSLFAGSDQPEKPSKSQKRPEKQAPGHQKTHSSPKPRPRPTASRPIPSSRPKPSPSPRKSPSPAANGGPDKSGTSKFGWILAVIAVIVFLVNISDDSPKKTPKQGSSTSKQTVQSQAHNTQQKLTETKPPVGTNHVLSRDQIRYCLVEGIRIDGMKPLVDNNWDSEVDRFNSLVNDYNSRCGQYRYQESSLRSAQRSISGRDGQYREEGRSRVRSWRQKQTSAGPHVSAFSKPKTKPSKLVRDTQKILTSLGYKPGAADGLAGQKTKSAVRQFQKDYRFRVDGVIDQQLYSRVYDLRPRDIPTNRSSNPNMQRRQSSAPHPKETECSHFKKNDSANYQRCLSGLVSSQKISKKFDPGIKPVITSAATNISSSDMNSIDNVCGYDKRTSGPAAYNRCVKKKQEELRQNPANFKISGVSESDQSSIDNVCGYDRRTSGPGAYNRCVIRKLAELKQNPSNFNTAGISSSDMNSIDNVCGYDKRTSGPAAYNRCVKKKQEELRQNPANFNTAGVSASDQNSIDNVCGYDKRTSGPGAYNHCVIRKLAELKRNPSNFNTAGISSSDMNSINNACGYDKRTSGPGAYNICVKRKLAALQ